MSLTHITNINHNIFTFIIYKYVIPTTDIRFWDAGLSKWSIDLPGPPLVEPPTRRNPAVYGYKNGYIIIIFNKEENSLITIKEFFFKYTRDIDFITHLYKVLIHNHLFTYFEMQTPCFQANEELSDYMVNHNEIMYIYVSGQPKNGKCELSYKDKDSEGKGGLWDKFEFFIDTSEKYIDEKMRYCYKLKKSGNNSLLIFDPYYNNGINPTLKDIYLDEDDNIIKDNDYCNIGSLLNSRGVDEDVKINYLKFLFEIMRINVEDENIMFSYFRGNAVNWVHWKKSNYDEYFKFWIMTPKEVYDKIIIQVHRLDTISLHGGKKKFNKKNEINSRKKRSKQTMKNSRKKRSKQTMKNSRKKRSKQSKIIIKTSNDSFDKILINLTKEINTIINDFEKSSMITYLAMDSFLNIFELNKLSIPEHNWIQILNICNKYFYQDNSKDIIIYDFIKTKYPTIDNELIYSIIKQKKILLNINTFNLLFNKYEIFDLDTINMLIEM
jgi:hypothetical protein